MSSVISSSVLSSSHDHQDGAAPTVDGTEEEQDHRQPSAINLSTPRGRSPEVMEYSESNASSVIRLGVSKPEYGSTPVIKTHDSSPSVRSLDSSSSLKSHDSGSGGGVSMMMPPGLQHMQHLIQQHLSPAQFQNFFQQQGLLMQQQVSEHNQLAELNKKQLEDAVRQLQEQLQLLMYQQSQAQHDKSKSAALSLHQSQLMQQLQLLQQRYLLQQAGMSQPGQTPGATTSEAPPWDPVQERRAAEAPSPPTSRHSPPTGNGLLPSALTNGRRDPRDDLRTDLRPDLRNGGVGDDERHDEEDLVAKTSPLYCNGICNWPGCECPCEDLQAFLKHLNTEHVLDDRSAAHARVQVQVVQLIESNLAKEKARLAAMMAHFRMAREKMTEPPPPEPPITPSHPPPRAPPTIAASSQPNQLLSGHPFLRSAILQGPTSSTAGPVRRRINDRSMTPGPYEEPPTQPRRRPADRAGQDITEELSRNREFYRTTDIRPPFTYASLIRQGIVESPEKQLTLNEIYSWFQSTFAYFRRNAATWKNAVRHNLSLHKCFTRVENVKGAVWTVDEVEFCKRRPQRSAGQARSPTLSSSPTLYGEAITAGLQSALVDSNLPFMHNAADRLREMRERDAPTLLGLQRRSPSPLRQRQPSRSPEALSVPKQEYDISPHTPELDPLHAEKSRDPVPGPPGNNDAEDLSMPAVKIEYGDTTPSVAEAASA